MIAASEPPLQNCSRDENQRAWHNFYKSKPDEVEQMKGPSYDTIKDLRSIVSNKIPEGVALEYKSSDIILRGKSNVICTTVSAFANSVGGQLIIGIESKDGEPIRLDDGVPGPPRRDWVFQIINAKTFPAVESVDILEIKEGDGCYYVITVPPSPQAPHQSADNRYYKRHGSHSLPMEHYEVEDVRSRPKERQPPLRVDFVAIRGIGFLKLRNDHESTSVIDVKCNLSSNVEFERDGIDSLDTRGLREVRAQTEKHFILDGIAPMLEKNPEAEIGVTIDYTFQGDTFRESITFYLGDFAKSAAIQSPTVEVLSEINEKVGRISQEIGKFGRTMEGISRIADGSGLRLSHRTLKMLKDVDEKFDPNEFDWQGYSIILGISSDEALSLYRIFGTMGAFEQKQKDYEKLSPDLRKKFETRFWLPSCRKDR
jgi:hypothetical protein